MKEQQILIKEIIITWRWAKTLMFSEVIILKNVGFFFFLNNPYKEGGSISFHIFKYIRQHTFHETQIGILSLNDSEHGKLFT